MIAVANTLHIHVTFNVSQVAAIELGERIAQATSFLDSAFVHAGGRLHWYAALPARFWTD